MKIGILYIATGRYIRFFKKFYKSCEKNFLKNHHKTYFLFTDAKINVPDNVVLIPVENLGYPKMTLFRFKFFLSVKEQLEKTDYLYFLNSNTMINKPVGEEIFPDEEQKIMVTLHPCYTEPGLPGRTCEPNLHSLAYLSEEDIKKSKYVCGGFNGGISAEYLKMCRELDFAIDEDLKNGIIAKWHDETHLNKYIMSKSPLIMPKEYLYPEKYYYIGEDFYNNYFELHNPFKYFKRHAKRYAKILLLDKYGPKCGGIDYARGLSDKKYTYADYIKDVLLRKLKNFFKKIR